MNLDIEFMYEIDDIYLKKQRAKARQLRKSQWWKRKRSSGICHYCKRKFLPKELTMDHVIPLVKGGKSEKINLVACCKECNTKKQSFLVYQMPLAQKFDI